WLVVASSLLLVYIAVGLITGTAIQGWTSLMLVVVVLGAAQMFVLGMIGEYLGRLFLEAKRRPLYIVSEIAGHAEGEARLGHVEHEAEEAAPQEAETMAAMERPGGIGRRPSA